MPAQDTLRTYNGDGTTTDFSIPFEYANQSEVLVTNSNGLPPSYTFVNPSVIRLPTALGVGEVLTIRRITDISAPVVVWTNGSQTTASHLNAMVDQLLHGLQDVSDLAQTSYDTSNEVINEIVPEISDEVDLALAKSAEALAKAEVALTNSQGVIGPQGPQGIQGPQGTAGAQGPAGTGVTIKGTVANTGALPASGNTTGDAYLISGVLYVWTGSAWQNAGNIQGPQGVQGPTGAQGPQGVKGDTGLTGPQGIQGLTGPAGPALGYDTRTLAIAATIGSSVNQLRTAGYTAIGDGGHALYRKVSTPSPVKAWHFQSADGAWWELSENLPNVRMLGAKGDGATNDTAAINNALEYCYTLGVPLRFPPGTYAVAEASSGVGYALLNKGVSMIGEPKLASRIVPLATMPNTADFIKVAPLAGAVLEFLAIEKLFIYPNADGTVRGNRGVYMEFNVSANMPLFRFEDCYIQQTNNWALQIENNGTVNPQGVPTFSSITRNMLFDGIRLSGVGDSVRVRDNTIRGTSTRPGVEVYNVDQSGGLSSHCLIESNNIDAAGGAIHLFNGRNTKIINNNIELSAGAGSNGAVVDVDGVSGQVVWPEVRSNHIGIFGTATATIAIRLNGAAGAIVDDNTLLAGKTVTDAIKITASATDAYIGRNEIDVGTNKFTNAVTDSGLRTAGVVKTLAFVAGFTNTGSGFAVAGFHKSKDGVVRLTGTINAPSSPNGLVIANLPLGFRPLSLMRYPVETLTGGAISVQVVEVDTTGNITLFTGGATTRLSLTGLNFPTQGHIVGSQ